MADAIPNFSVIKLIANGFPDSVQYYLSVWAPYHQALANTAGAVIFPASLVWLMFLTAKFSTEKAKALVGGIFMVAVLGILISPTDRGAEMFGAGGAGKSIAVANGSYWSYKIPGAIYGLFKSALMTVDNKKSVAQNVSMKLAYELQTDSAARKMEAGPLRDIYLAYATSCNKATSTSAVTSNPQLVADLQMVGLHGGSGIGYRPSDYSVPGAILRDLSQSASTLTSWAAWKRLGSAPMTTLDAAGRAIVAPYDEAKGAADYAEGIARGRAALASIPASENPFRTVTTDYIDGFKIPTQSYWLTREGLPAIDGESDFIDARTFKNGVYKSPEIAESDVPGAHGAAITGAAYPDSCAEAFELADAALREYRLAREKILQKSGSTAVDKSFNSVQAVTDLGSLSNKLREEADSISSNGKLKPGYTAGTFNRASGPSFADRALDGIAGLATDIGAWKDSIFLKYKVPFVVGGCAMLVAALIIAFPLFAVMSLFMGPGLLVTYIKLVCFGFLVVFFNDLFLSMGGDLIGITRTLAVGAGVGHQAQGSTAVDIAAVSTEVLIYSSITVVEIMLAKILIWDDVQSVSGFSPSGSFGTAMAAGGGLIAGAMAIGASLIPGGGVVASVAKTGLGAAGSATSMATGGRGPGGGGGGGLRPPPSAVASKPKKSPSDDSPPASGIAAQGSAASAVRSSKSSASTTNMTPP